MAEYLFKTVYFPRERVRAGTSARVTVSLPAGPHSPDIEENFIRYAQGLSSRDFRLALGDPDLEALEELAHQEGRSLSNICLRLLIKHYQAGGGQLAAAGENIVGQLTLPLLEVTSAVESVSGNEPKGDLGVTFRDSLRQHVYGWYPYVEGFSVTYTRDAILRYGPRTVYDPFGGAGTTQLVASCLGIPSFYSEVNPFMAFVAETKVNGARWACQNFDAFEDLARAYVAELTQHRLDKLGTDVDLGPYERAFPGRDFFVERDLRHLLAACELARRLTPGFDEACSLFLLACAANAVRSSNMTRRADLRRRRPDEYKTRVVDVGAYIAKTVQRMVDDVRRLPANIAPVVKVSHDCREIPPQYANSFELALTSPPYLNGTNYFRNTKIELWLLGLIDSERELKGLRKRAICAGINNVSREREKYEPFDSVEAIASALDQAAGDRRIPLLVRHYFSDMKCAFKQVMRSLVPGGMFLLDIGDSKFYGVHVPTDDLLVDVARSVGFHLEHRHVLARRHSRDKTDLVQVELVLRKPQRQSSASPARKRKESLVDTIAHFKQELPYKCPPYTKRNWGHSLHSLCSYQGKLKPALAHWLVREFVPEDGRVLDPLGGVGTIPLEAALQGHWAVSNDKSPFAAIVAAAKLDPPSPEEAERALHELCGRMEKVILAEEDFASAQFGLNGTVADFYHEKTLEEVLRARRIFAATLDDRTRGDNFVWAVLLHILHGNRPYALSRTSHPITPFHPRGPAVYKNLIEKVHERINRVLRARRPVEFRGGVGFHGDFRELVHRDIGEFDAIVTSPPFLGMRFDRPNWLRLWFCGWNEKDFHETSLGFLERQQTKSVNCYADFFKVCRALLKDTGVAIIHLGSGGKGDLVGAFKELSNEAFELAGEVIENVQAIEQHGIRDKGRTTNHHMLFFTPRW